MARWRVFNEVSFLDRVFRDSQNYNAIPARWLHAAGITLGPFARWPLTLGVEARNLFDLRVVDLPLGGSANAGRTTPYPLVDFFDYPLPGRAIYATLALRPLNSFLGRDMAHENGLSCRTLALHWL